MSSFLTFLFWETRQSFPVVSTRWKVISETILESIAGLKFYYIVLNCFAYKNEFSSLVKSSLVNLVTSRTVILAPIMSVLWLLQSNKGHPVIVGWLYFLLPRCEVAVIGSTDWLRLNKLFFLSLPRSLLRWMLKNSFVQTLINLKLSTIVNNDSSTVLV